MSDKRPAGFPCPECVDEHPHDGLILVLAMGFAMPYEDCPWCGARFQPHRRDYEGQSVSVGVTVEVSDE